MRRLFAWLDANGERSAMLVFYLFCCIVIVQEVVRRFVLNYSSAWGEEAARYAFIYLGWLGAAHAVHVRAHIRFDIVIGAVGPRAKSLLYILAESLTILFACIAFWWSMHTIMQLLQFDARAAVLPVNKVWFEAAVPIAFALIVVRSVQRIVGDWKSFLAGSEPSSGLAMFEE